MPFSSAIRNEVLVDSARHCAVCRRYKNVGVEVHHIQPESEGGPNTYDNAVCLCFDCHTAAGHYNDAHPKGTKYSKPELRLAREKLYQIVREGKVGAPANEEISVLFRFVLCSSSAAIHDIVSGMREGSPIGRFQLLQNNRLREMKFAFENYQLHRAVEGPFIEDFEEFVKARPDFDKVHSRPLEIADVKGGKFSNLFLAQMIDSGVDPAQIGRVDSYLGECGGSRWCEVLITRQLLACFVQVINDSDRRIMIDSMLSYEGNCSVFTQLDTLTGTPATSRIAPCILEPDSSVLIPLGVLFGPSENTFVDGNELVSIPIGGEQVESLSLVDCNAHELAWYGPMTKILGVGGSVAGERFFCESHELGSAPGLYRIDRHWLCGSCPYVACQNAINGTWYVLGETLSNSPSPELSKQYLIRLPDSTEKIRIVEAEHETAHIESIFIDDLLVMSDITLHLGDCIELDVAGANAMIVTGYYEAPLAYPVTHDQQMQKQRQRNKLQASLNHCAT
jgi:HNH endonuclease